MVIGEGRGDGKERGRGGEEKTVIQIDRHTNKLTNKQTDMQIDK